MFTVLVRKPNKTEVLYSAQEVEKEPGALIMRGDSLGGGDHKGLEILGPKGQTMTWDWERPRDISPLPQGECSEIFVMNSRGKTIAIYSL